jgi:excisionase family DNA binding protein
MPAPAVSPPPAEDVFLTYEEAAVRAGVSFRTITTWVAEGLVPAVRSGKRTVRVSRDGLDRYVAPRVR